MSDITIVTAFFDIGRSNWNKTSFGVSTPHYVTRSTDSYFSYFENLAKMQNDMIIFCSEEHRDRIKEIRARQAPHARTEIVGVDFEDTVRALKPVVQYIQKRPEYINMVDDPRMPEYWNADYVLVNYLKTDFVEYAYTNRLINTELAAWLDFGYVRGEQTLPKSLYWSYPFDNKKMHYFNKTPIDFGRPIFDIIKTNTVYIMGCHIVGGKEAWIKHKKMFHSSVDKLIACGLIDDDQTVLLMNYRAHQKEIELHSINVEAEEWNEWNVAMIKFNTAKDT